MVLVLVGHANLVTASDHSRGAFDTGHIQAGLFRHYLPGHNGAVALDLPSGSRVIETAQHKYNIIDPDNKTWLKNATLDEQGKLARRYLGILEAKHRLYQDTLTYQDTTGPTANTAGSALRLPAFDASNILKKQLMLN